MLVTLLKNFIVIMAHIERELDPVLIDTGGCTEGDKTYVINFHAHVQNDVKDSIVSLASKLNSVSLVDEIQDEGG